MHFFIKIFFVILIIILACILINYIKRIIGGGIYEIDYNLTQGWINYFWKNMEIISIAVKNWNKFSGSIINWKNGIIIDKGGYSNENITINTEINDKIRINLENNILKWKTSRNEDKFYILFGDPLICFYPTFKENTISNLFFEILLKRKEWQKYKESILDELALKIGYGETDYFACFIDIHNILMKSISTKIKSDNKLFIYDILTILNALINFKFYQLSSRIYSNKIISLDKIKKEIAILCLNFVFFNQLKYKIMQHHVWHTDMEREIEGETVVYGRVWQSANITIIDTFFNNFQENIKELLLKFPSINPLIKRILHLVPNSSTKNRIEKYL